MIYANLLTPVEYNNGYYDIRKAISVKMPIFKDQILLKE